MSTFRFGKRGSALIAGAGLALLLTTGPTVASPKIGAPAPEFVGIDSKGKTVKLSSFKGKTVVLEWTNHDCPYVRKHYRTTNMQKLQKKAAADGIVWLSIISSAPGEQGYVKGQQADKLNASRNAAPSMVILDPNGKIGRLYGAQTTPHMYIIKKDGTLAYKGAIDSKDSSDDEDIKTAINYVSKALKQISAGKKVNPAVTQPYGCSVKYPS